jgi:ABC-type Fe3+-siderophore transport system permease subunit
MFVGSDNKILIPAAALMGAVIMLLSDSLVQIIGSGMPVGIITSILGGPVFLFLIIRQKKEVW